MNTRNIFQAKPCSRVRFTPLLALVGLCASAITSADADNFGSGGNAFTVPFVPIGNAGNGADTTGYGAVSYNYNISTYAISQADLTDAVNLGAATAYGAPNLGGNWSGNQPAAGIQWYQAAAFVNWLNTSQGYTAAYNLSYSGGAWSMTLSSNPFPLGGGLFDAYRNANAHYFLPSENEYYKAAYHKNDGVTADYWQYATGSNTVPTAVASGTAAGTAVYFGGGASQPAAVDQSGGLSPYGTMGQSGNVWEWMETSSAGDNTSPSEGRADRGGDFEAPTFLLLASSSRGINASPSSVNGFGFRVASIPEPSTVGLIIGPCLMFMARRRRARSL